MTHEPAIPRAVGAPARRALAAAGYLHLRDLQGVAAGDLLHLHGVGAKAVGVLADALAEQGWTLAQG